jgi:hypothetical protein
MYCPRDGSCSSVHGKQAKLHFCNSARLFLNHILTNSPQEKQWPPARMIFINDGATARNNTTRSGTEKSNGRNTMASMSGKSVTNDDLNLHSSAVKSFPAGSTLESTEQIRRFELLRLAFFGLKLRKIDQRLLNEEAGRGATELSQDVQGEWEFRRNLLRHAIYQQMVTLIKLDARDQALQIIEACQH